LLGAPKETVGGIAYLKKVGGINHVFVSRFVGGAFQPPEQVDTGLADPSRRVFISAANGGRLAVTFLNAADANPTGHLDTLRRLGAGRRGAASWSLRSLATRLRRGA
jgi:hypothetical protein